MNNIRIKCRKTKQTQVDIRPTTVMAMIFSRLVYFRVWIKLKKKKQKQKILSVSFNEKHELYNDDEALFLSAFQV